MAIYVTDRAKDILKTEYVINDANGKGVRVYLSGVG